MQDPIDSSTDGLSWVNIRIIIIIIIKCNRSRCLDENQYKSRQHVGDTECSEDKMILFISVMNWKEFNKIAEKRKNDPFVFA